MGCRSACAAAADAALLDAARRAQPAVIESLKDMVMIESGSANVEGLAKMADYTERRLKELGAKTERIKAHAGRRRRHRQGHVQRHRPKRLMLMAHMDTVYQPNTLATQPYKLDGNQLYGPGIADDKGGIAVILHALKILNDAGWKQLRAGSRCCSMPTRRSARSARARPIATLADEHDYVLSCEPTGAKAIAKNEGLLLGAAGTATVTLEVKGRASHAGAAPELGRNALIELAHQLLQTRDVAKSVPGTQLNWTTSRVGEVRNQIPERRGRHRRRAHDRGRRRREAAGRAAGQGQGRGRSCRTPRRRWHEIGRPAYVAERSVARAREARRRRSTPSSTAAS